MDYRTVSGVIPIKARLQLWFVAGLRILQNGFLESTRRLLFRSAKKDPQVILIFKVGNIGDITCAIPALIAIRRAYPTARLTLLSSPGRRGAPGAAELLTGAWYLDELVVYHAEDIISLSQRRDLIRRLRLHQPDLFIQLPDDLVNWAMLFRNILFARAIGARAAIGFVVRTLGYFKQVQVDYLQAATETDSLIGLLRKFYIPVEKIEFNFPVTSKQTQRVQKLFLEQWRQRSSAQPVIALGPGGKRPANRWPVERFAEAARTLEQRHQTYTIILGGLDDRERAKMITAKLTPGRVWDATGSFNLLETTELLRLCSLLIANSTGTAHLAAAVGLPTVGLYTPRDVPGRWSPFGSQHRVLCRTKLRCSYRSEACLEHSLNLIAVEEVVAAATTILRLKRT